MMEIKVNGKSSQVKDKSRVSGLLRHLKIPVKTCAIELNGRILKREEFSSVVIKPGDNVEIIRLMAGGE
ncbi:sulfur carrier protein ThiS [Candidatus Saganbacteria bacterium]|nr:sulfur carrier protein ThiS [Candidatus Saganbacteria bacterium]